MRVAVLIALAACESSPPPTAHHVVAELVAAVDRRDADAAQRLLVSPGQIARLLRCEPATRNTWATPAGRAVQVTAQLDRYRRHQAAGTRVALGSLWDEYTYGGEVFHAYKPGDAIGDCRVTAAYVEQHFRIQLELDELGRHIVATKPIELWQIDGGWYVHDDPMETEGW